MPISLEYALKINPDLNPDLFLPDPKSVLEALDKPPISEWLNFIGNEFLIPKTKYLIMVPCSAYKPYEPPRDRLYKCISKLKRRLRNTYFVTISVPLAVEPEDYWGFKWRGYNLIYDAPFFPWIEKFGYKWDRKIVDEVLKRLGKILNKFLERNGERYEVSVAFLAPSVPDRKMVEGKVTFLVPSHDPPIEPSYDDNASEVHCYPSVWNEFIETLMNVTGEGLEGLKK